MTDINEQMETISLEDQVEKRKSQSRDVVSVPEASPDGNDDTLAKPHRRSNRNAWIIFGLVFALLVAAIVVTVVVAIQPYVLATSSLEQVASAAGQASGITSAPVESSNHPNENFVMCTKPLPGNCITKTSYEQCLALSDAGCKTIVETPTCPPKYSCIGPHPDAAVSDSEEAPTAAPKEKTTNPVPEKKTTPPAIQTRNQPHSLTENQSTPVQNSIAATKSVQHSTKAVEHKVTVMKVPHQCHRPAQGTACHTKASFDSCLTLAAAGCNNIVSSFNCPPNYFCADDLN